MFKKAMIAGIALAAFATVQTAKAEMPNPLTFGIISTESSQGLKKSFTPFLDDMSKALGVKVKAFFASDYAGVIEAMRFKKVDVAWFGNKSAMEAVDRAGVRAIVAPLKSVGRAVIKSLEKYKGDFSRLTDLARCTFECTTLSQALAVLEAWAAGTRDPAALEAIAKAAAEKAKVRFRPSTLKQNTLRLDRKTISQ